MILNRDFREFIQSLNDNDVRYLIVGGYAVAFHGHPRYTKDLDVWIWVDQQNAEKMILRDAIKKLLTLNRRVLIMSDYNALTHTIFELDGNPGWLFAVAPDASDRLRDNCPGEQQENHRCNKLLHSPPSKPSCRHAS